MKKKNPTSFTDALLRANLSDLVGKMAKDPYFDTNATRLHFTPAELQPVAIFPGGVAGGCISQEGVAL